MKPVSVKAYNNTISNFHYLNGNFRMIFPISTNEEVKNLHSIIFEMSLSCQISFVLFKSSKSAKRA